MATDASDRPQRSKWAPNDGRTVERSAPWDQAANPKPNEMGELALQAVIPLYFVAGVLLLYVAVLLGLTYILPLQNLALYANFANVPWKPAYDTPERYGFYPSSWRCFRLLTSDGIELGATQMLPVDSARSAGSEHGLAARFSSSVFDSALTDKDRLTAAYFHGNAGNRMQGNRLEFARVVTGRMRANFVAVDYRGFGDSQRVAPSEDGLVLDAHATWDWLVAKGVRPQNIVLIGASLGTGVATTLAHQLCCEGIRPRALILVAPYTSLPELLLTYKVGRFLPLLAPLSPIPALRTFLLRSLRTRFETDTRIAGIGCPILLLHAMDDDDIPFNHSRALFNILLDAHCCEEAGSTASDDKAVSVALVAAKGTVRRFTRSAGKGPVVFGNPEFGAHDPIHSDELALELIEEIVRG